MAVYTHLSQAELAHLGRVYRLEGQVTAHPIAEGVENSNYRLESGHPAQPAKHILTVFEKRVRPGDLPFFLGLMNHLAARGLDVPRPLVTKSGTMSCPVREEKQAAIVTFLEGRSIEKIELPHLAALGAQIAGLHQAVDDFPMNRVNDLSLAGWRKLADAIGGRADEIAPGLGARIGEELGYLEAHWPHDLESGVIHADLFVDNVFFDGARLSGVIDFYFACRDAFLYDLAIAMNAWCFDGTTFDREKSRALLKAYRGARQSRDGDWPHLPILARGAALRFLLTRAYDWLHRQEGALVTIKDPLEYAAKLAFHQNVRDIGAYGL